jgi:NADH-quinone oxidoreductase subunit L
MVFPVLALGALAAVGGVLSLPFKGLEFLTDWLEPAFEGVPKLEASSFLGAAGLSAISVMVGVVGLVVGVVIYRGGLRSPEHDPLDERLGPVGRLFGHAYYFDESIAALVRGPIRVGADWLSRGFDRGIIDGAVNGVGRLFRGFGDQARKLQTGLVRQYALGIVLGLVLLLLYVVERGL